MNRSHLKLIYSKDNEDSLVASREQWGLSNAQQLSLFDDMDSIHVVIVSTDDQNAHTFFNLITKHQPSLIVDTRQYPDFFRLFNSTSLAFEWFKEMGITYIRTPIAINAQTNINWAEIGLLQNTLETQEHRYVNHSIFILVSTRHYKEIFKTRLEGFVSQQSPKKLLLDG